MGEHQWGPPDRNGIRACVRVGCLVRWWEGGRSWQERTGMRWRAVSAVPVPRCDGCGADAARCSHVERIGIVSKAHCARPVLPRLVVCEHHATPDALRLVILSMQAEIERLMSSG